MWTIILMLTFAADLRLHSWVAQFTVEVMKSGKQPGGDNILPVGWEPVTSDLPCWLMLLLLQ